MRRLRPRASKALLVLSLVLAFVTTIALRDHLARIEAEAAAPGPGTPLLVAARDLPRGSEIAADAVRLREFPDAFVPPGALSSLAETAGRTLASGVAEGEPITLSRLAPPGGPVAALVPAGFRALPVTVAVPQGAVAPGDRVDLLATYASGAPHTEIVVEEVEVLMLLEAPSLEGTSAATLVLLVTPETAERIAFAKAFADLSVAVAPSVGS